LPSSSQAVVVKQTRTEALNECERAASCAHRAAGIGQHVGSCNGERTDGLLGMGTVLPILLLKYATWSYSCWNISFARACMYNVQT